MLSSKLKLFFPQLASLISGFLKATQLFSPNPLSSPHTAHVEMLSLSLSNIAVSPTIDFFSDLLSPKV